MAALDPAIHDFLSDGKQDVDHRDKPGDDKQSDGSMLESYSKRPCIHPASRDRIFQSDRDLCSRL